MPRCDKLETQETYQDFHLQLFKLPPNALRPCCLQLQLSFHSNDTVCVQRKISTHPTLIYCSTKTGIHLIPYIASSPGVLHLQFYGLQLEVGKLCRCMLVGKGSAVGNATALYNSLPLCRNRRTERNSLRRREADRARHAAT